MNQETKTGKVKFYNVAKGYGFIIEEGTETEYFVHATGLANGYQINQNDKVTFEVTEGKKGLNAVKVKIAF